ncbi:MAG: hypothetical protein GY797_19995 [Deltaproteobacteria bacterium]|nr:hypothetical protein [Deltaproteobacteria bacterium]
MNNLYVSRCGFRGFPPKADLRCAPTRDQGFKGSSEMLKNYKELNVWQKSYELCLKIYQITAKFPKEAQRLENGRANSRWTGR